MLSLLITMHTLAKLNGQLLCIEKENSIKICNIYVNSKQGNYKTTYSLQSNNLDQYSLSIWHKRLCHFYNNNLIKYLNGHTINKTLCIGCKISKLKKEPFRKTLNARSPRPLELIHSDIIGPLKESRNNFKYILTFLDDFTRKSWIYLLKRKSEVPEIFENFIRMVTNESNLTITKIQSDNGKEYTSRKFIDICNKAGIQRNLIVPRNPQSNERAERLNGTIINV